MKSFQEIFDEIIPPTEKCSLFGYYEIEQKCREISERYALQVGEDMRQKCADNAEANYRFEAQLILAIDSIMNTEVILP